MSEITQKIKKKKNIFKIISICLTVLPLLVYTILAFINGSVGQKTAMGICLTTALIFTTLNVIFKHKIRCTIWILLLGIYYCIGNIVTLLLIMFITTALDEFCFEPLAKRYAQKYEINKELDARG